MHAAGIVVTLPGSQVARPGSAGWIWKQIEGSLTANHGRISFTTTDGKVHIDYRAAIDIGLPELWTQSCKETFIRVFLTAARERATTADSPAALARAAEP